MNDDSIKKEQEETWDSASVEDAQEKTSAAEKEQEKKSASGKKVFSKIPKIDLSMIEAGAIFAGVEYICEKARTFDLQVTKNAGGLFAKVTNYINNSKEIYKKKK